MQPIDRADPRPPNVQIAASIRAAILTGELEPGTRLQSGQELARFFGVARQTVQTAINALRAEGGDELNPEVESGRSKDG